MGVFYEDLAHMGSLLESRKEVLLPWKRLEELYPYEFVPAGRLLRLRKKSFLPLFRREALVKETGRTLKEGDKIYAVFSVEKGELKDFPLRGSELLLEVGALLAEELKGLPASLRGLVKAEGYKLSKEGLLLTLSFGGRR